MLTYRPLTINDTDQLIDLIKARPFTFNGYTDEQFQQNILEIIPQELDNPLCFFPAVFSDGVLQGTLYARESEHSPSWTWGWWVNRLDSPVNIYTPDGMQMAVTLDRELFDEMETRRKLTRFFVAYQLRDDVGTGLKTVGMSDRLFAWMTRSTKRNFRIARYKFFTDCIVDPGQRAPYAYQRAILGDREWPLKLGIRMGVIQSNDSGS